MKVIYLVDLYHVDIESGFGDLTHHLQSFIKIKMKQQKD